MNMHELAAQITRPTLLLDRARVLHNTQRMVTKAQRSGVRLRPHFKTHQSAAVAEWLRASGVTSATVSSVDMAAYFAQHGWDDITIAFPCNPRQIAQIDAIAARIQLGVIVGTVGVVRQLDAQLHNTVRLWIEIDTGYGRTGIPWQQTDEIIAVARAIAEGQHLHFAGLLTYGGRAYGGGDPQEIIAIHRETNARVNSVRALLQAAGFADLAVSVGDTPSCSVVERFEGIDEVRPGNFVFYDLMQLDLGVCRAEDIAVAVACPVVATFPERGTIVVYGGAVHFAKDFLMRPDGTLSFGQVAAPAERGWGAPIDGAYVAALSQEHGTINAPAALLASVQIGDLLTILPVHSCLTADLLKGYLTLDGERLPMFALHDLGVT